MNLCVTKKCKWSYKRSKIFMQMKKVDEEVEQQIWILQISRRNDNKVCNSHNIKWDFLYKHECKWFTSYSF